MYFVVRKRVKVMAETFEELIAVQLQNFRKAGTDMSEVHTEIRLESLANILKEFRENHRKFVRSDEMVQNERSRS